MDVRMLSMCSRNRSFLLSGCATLFALCVVVSLTTLLSGCGNAGTLSSTVGVDGDTVIDPIDLSGDGGAACGTSYRNDDQGFGFELDVLAVEAAGQVLNADADFAGAWSFSTDGVGVVVSAEVNRTDFPADLALIVATANADITAAGGTVAVAFELILSNGDEASQTNYTQDGTFSYRVDVIKNEKLYTLTVSATEADITQQVDNAMIAAVASLCVD